MTPLAGHYRLPLVALSIVIAILAAGAALDLAGRVTATRGRAQGAWLAGGAFAMGLGIWSMHYTGMLAFQLPVAVAYHLSTVLASLLAATLASGVALFLASGARLGPWRIVIGSVVMGAPGARPAPSGPAADVIVSGSGGSVRITAAQVVLADVRLEGGGTCSGIEADEQDGHDSAEVHDDSMEASDSGDVADSDDVHESPDTNEHDCEPLNVGPVTVNLPLDGSTKVALDGLAPAGTYTGLRAKIEGVTATGVFTDSGGTDHAFTFTSDAETEVEMNFPAP